MNIALAELFDFHFLEIFDKKATCINVTAAYNSLSKDICDFHELVFTSIDYNAEYFQMKYLVIEDIKILLCTFDMKEDMRSKRFVTILPSAMSNIF